MSSENRKNQPLLLLGLTILILLFMQMIPEGIKILGYSVKPFDLFIDIKPDSLISERKIEPQLISYASIIDNILAPIFNHDPYPCTSPYELAPDVKISGNTGQLSYFITAVKNSKNSKIRIAHYGDSAIEGDLITADLRQKLQDKFGGNGPGFLSITSEDIKFRFSMKHSFSDDWAAYSVFAGNPKKYILGINGTVSVPEGKSWVKYEVTGRFKSLKSFSTVNLYYTDAKSLGIKYSFNDGPEKSLSLQPGSGVKQQTLTSSGEGRSFKLSSVIKDHAKFFGVSFEGGNGIYVDNFPLRGNSGVGLKDISVHTLNEFQKFMNYKLIILSFGLNMASQNLTDYGWYEKEMLKVISHLKESFPQTSILIVSAGDKCIKKGSRFVTDPNILKVIDVQKKIADKSGVAFWNLFEAMGGSNSMNEWVNSKPPLAMKDYTHVTLEGAQKIAYMLSKALIDEYEKQN